MGLRYHQVKHVFFWGGWNKEIYQGILENLGGTCWIRYFLWKIRWTSRGTDSVNMVKEHGELTVHQGKKMTWNPAWIGSNVYADTIWYHPALGNCLMFCMLKACFPSNTFNITFLHYRSLGGLHPWWHMSRCQIFDPENWPAEGNSRPATCEGWRRTCSTGWRGVIAKQYPLQSHLRTSHKRYTRNTTFLYMLDFKMMFLGDLRFLQYLGVSNE
jgi:hypothetical protein